MRHSVDRARGEVRANVAGLAESRAVNRPPYGCVNATGTDLLGVPARAASAPVPLLEVTDAALAPALTHAFEESPSGPLRHTHAVVVMLHGRIVAERYAAGITPATPLAGWSATKSATNALLGVLVRQGRLDMNAPAPIAAWADPVDPAPCDHAGPAAAHDQRPRYRPKP